MCTGMRFNDTEGRMFFGRNLDWTFDYGERALVVPRGFKPASPFGATSEISHALIGMGIVEEGQPLLFDAGNDAGLAVAGLNFPGYAEYAPAPIEGKTNVAAWEFPLWVAANFATVDEVAAALQDAVIVDEPIAPEWPSALLHWIIGDATRSIVVEYTAAGMQVFENPVDVLSPVTAGTPRTCAITSTYPAPSIARAHSASRSLRSVRVLPSAACPATTVRPRVSSAPRMSTRTIPPRTTRRPT